MDVRGIILGCHCRFSHPECKEQQKNSWIQLFHGEKKGFPFYQLFAFKCLHICQQIVGNTPKKNNVRNKVLLRHTHVKTSRLHYVCHAKFMANPSESMMTFPYFPGMLGRCSAFANYALTYHILLNSCKITILHTSFMRNSWVIMCFFTPTNHCSFNTHRQPPKPRKPGPSLLKCLFHSQWITMRYKAPIRSNHWETIQKQHAWQEIPSKFSQVQQTNPKLSTYVLGCFSWSFDPEKRRFFYNKNS